jgi:hypothetical protein
VNPKLVKVGSWKLRGVVFCFFKKREEMKESERERHYHNVGDEFFEYRTDHRRHTHIAINYIERHQSKFLKVVYCVFTR